MLHGLLRVRGFTQDDAHLFCRPDQIETEVSHVLDFTFFILGPLALRNLKCISRPARKNPSVPTKTGPLPPMRLEAALKGREDRLSG